MLTHSHLWFHAYHWLTLISHSPIHILIIHAHPFTLVISCLPLTHYDFTFTHSHTYNSCSPIHTYDFTLIHLHTVILHSPFTHYDFTLTIYTLWFHTHHLYTMISRSSIYIYHCDTPWFHAHYWHTLISRYTLWFHPLIYTVISHSPFTHYDFTFTHLHTMILWSPFTHYDFTPIHLHTMISRSHSHSIIAHPASHNIATEYSSRYLQLLQHVLAFSVVSKLYYTFYRSTFVRAPLNFNFIPIPGLPKINGLPNLSDSFTLKSNSFY